MEAIYRIEGDRVVTGMNAGGPWDPMMQHGGAPSSLVMRVAEATPSLVPMRVARLTIDLMRPVPIAPLVIDARIVRQGKKLQLLSISLLADGLEVVRASVLRLRREPTPLPAAADGIPLGLPGPEEGLPPRITGGCAFNTGVEDRIVRGAFGQPGPASIWFRCTRQIVEGEELLPSMRAAIAGDYCNGTSSFLDFRQWTFINADLQISLARDPIGEWILLDAETYAGPDGGGHAFARLGDRQGWFGRAGQSVIFERR